MMVPIKEELCCKLICVRVCVFVDERLCTGEFGDIISFFFVFERKLFEFKQMCKKLI